MERAFLKYGPTYGHRPIVWRRSHGPGIAADDVASRECVDPFCFRGMGKHGRESSLSFWLPEESIKSIGASISSSEVLVNY